MITLRHNRRWLALTLILAMVSTIAGIPAHAVACGTLSTLGQAAAVAYEPGAPSSCKMTGRSGPCCCGPNAAQATAPETGCRLSSPGCGCAVEAPQPPSPANVKA